MGARLSRRVRSMHELLRELENDSSLFQPDQLIERIDALDRLDLFDMDAPHPVSEGVAAAVLRRARAMQAKLEAANCEAYEAIRGQVRVGAGAQALRQWSAASSRHAELRNGHPGEGYDALDELVAGILQFEELAAETVQLTPEMVAYQPTPARHIFDLFDRAGLTGDDVLIDLGSGLGHVPLLTCISTKARSIGVELEPVYIASARQAAERLNLTRARFVEQDARAADLTEGTLFYLYTPFKGALLRAVLDAVQREAASRRIRVCTYGPCTVSVAEEDWLEPIGSPRVNRISMFRSRE